MEAVLRENPDIALVHTTHNETGTGLLNPIREIGALAHRYGAVFTVDTTSTLAMRPIHIEEDNIDFCMASAQKGLMAMTGLSFIIGNRKILERSKDYPKRSYYCNLYLQYHVFETTGEMHFTPPVQTIYAAIQALREYFAEGEEAKWARHTRVFRAIEAGLDAMGFRQVIRPEWRAGLVAAAVYPDDPVGTSRRCTITATPAASRSIREKSPPPTPSACALSAPSMSRISTHSSGSSAKRWTPSASPYR